MVFKNFCPYSVGEILLTTNSTNPSSIFLGTTWQKIEGRFLLGTSGSGASKQTGGSNSKTISQANLPNVKLAVDAITGNISVSRLTAVYSKGHDTTSSITYTLNIPESGRSGDITLGGNGGAGWVKSSFSNTKENKSFNMSPQTSALGSGQALDITPSYYTVHMWLRLT